MWVASIVEERKLRKLRILLTLLVCGVGLLIIGILIPRLILAGEGIGRYEGEERAYAGFVLVYDSTLRDWPFPIDPTVARQVTGMRSADRGDECTGSGEETYGGADFSGNFSAEVIHYGPFFVPTGKNVFDCDGARTFRSLMPEESGMFFGYAVLAWGFLSPIAALSLLVLLIGGATLAIRGRERTDRNLGFVACAEGIVVVAIAAFAVL